MSQRRLQDRIENLIIRALPSDDPAQLHAIIEELRQALHEEGRVCTSLCSATR